MRIRVLSDIHLEFEDWVPPQVEADVVVIAGDLNKATRGLPWIKRHFPSVPVVYLAGNHEFYGQTLENVLEDLRDQTQSGQIHFLHNASVEIGEVVFLGCTLWTDFNLYGDPAVAGAYAARGMNDYRLIRTSPAYRRLKGRDTAGFHAQSRRWLEATLPQFAGRKIVVATHHAPSAKSLNPAFEGDLLGAAYASPLDDLVARSGAVLWIHGHTHRSVDYKIGETRIIANQRGYPDQTETGFQPDLVVTI
ncbi:MAG TPA: metallophosphoesterase [Candidatus Limnocylindria bacterium]|jgi:predicted phosphodiesterase|nr:metallophosphoesterase [Candidatus Limnocylindria bacterium]